MGGDDLTGEQINQLLRQMASKGRLTELCTEDHSTLPPPPQDTWAPGNLTGPMPNAWNPQERFSQRADSTVPAFVHVSRRTGVTYDHSDWSWDTATGGWEPPSSEVVPTGLSRRLRICFCRTSLNYLNPFQPFRLRFATQLSVCSGFPGQLHYKKSSPAAATNARPLSIKAHNTDAVTGIACSAVLLANASHVLPHMFAFV